MRQGGGIQGAMLAFLKKPCAIEVFKFDMVQEIREENSEDLQHKNSQGHSSGVAILIRAAGFPGAAG